MSIASYSSIAMTDYTFTRRSGSYVNGRWSDGTATTFTLKCTIQPHISGNMSVVLPEGDRGKKRIFIITRGIDTQLRTAKEGSSLLKGDEVTWNGEVYEIREVLVYELGVLNGCQAIGIRKEVA